MNPVGWLRAITRIVLLVVMTCLLLILQVLWLGLTAFNGARARQSPVVMFWHRVVLWILNVNVTPVNKRLLDRQQKIYVGNHVSYLDIMALGACIDCFFIAKMDIAHWPIMGFLAKVGGTIFVVRERKHVRSQLDMLKCELSAGRSLMIFAEGTTGNGRDILPFKSSLLKSAFQENGALPIQPIGIIYTYLNGRKLIAADQFDRIAWYGDMTLGPHLWYLLRQKSVSARIIVHPRIAPDQNRDARQAAHAAHAAIAHDFIDL